jgi:anti-anti-sigma factor
MKTVINKRMFQNIPVVKISGGVSGEDAVKLSEKIGFLHKTDTDRIIIDLSETFAMDSSAVGVLVYWWKLLKLENKRLILLKPHDAISEMLETTNLDKFLPIIDSLLNLDA